MLATEAPVQLAVLQCAALCFFPPQAVFCRYVQAVNSAWHCPKADDIFGLGTETVVRRHSPGLVLRRINVMVKEILMASELFLDHGPYLVTTPMAVMLSVFFFFVVFSPIATWLALLAFTLMQPADWKQQR